MNCFSGWENPQRRRPVQVVRVDCLSASLRDAFHISLILSGGGVWTTWESCDICWEFVQLFRGFLISGLVSLEELNNRDLMGEFF